MNKLELFWRICVLPELLGTWYTRECHVPDRIPRDNAICFCRGHPSDDMLSCSNSDCPYRQFHTSCLALNEVFIPQKWYCPYCNRLPQFKRCRGATKAETVTPSTVNKDAILCENICICKATTADRLVKCHNAACKNGNFFHWTCLGLKRMPNNAKTTWLCGSCKGKKSKITKQPTTCASTSLESSELDSDSESIDDVTITKVTSLVP